MKNTEEKALPPLVPIKIKVVPYEFIVSESIRMFFDNHQEYFYKENGQYIFVRNIDPNVLKNILLSYMTSIITDKFHRNLFHLDTLYFIVDNCYPHMNWRRNDYQSRLTEEANKFIKRETMLKYLIKERDIKIDELAFNSAFDKQFTEFFTDPEKVLTYLGHNNIIFFKNAFMTETDVYSSIENVFGKYNVSHEFNTAKHLKHTIEMNSLIYKKKAFKDVKIPEELSLTCAQIIDIMFIKLFGNEE